MGFRSGGFLKRSTVAWGEGMTETDTSLARMTQLWLYLLLSSLKATRAGTKNDFSAHIMTLLAALGFVR